MTLLIHYRNNNPNEYVCTQYANEFSSPKYILPSTEVDFFHNDETYFFNITLYLNNQLSFSDEFDRMFASVSFDGIIPYSVLEADHKYVEIPLQEGKAPEQYSFTISADDYAFSGEDLEILTSFLNHENDQLVLSINLFDPNGYITHVSNFFLK